MFSSNTFFGPSPVGSMSIEEKRFFPVDSEDEELENASLSSLEGLLPELDTVDLTSFDWHAAAMAPDTMGTLATDEEGYSTKLLSFSPVATPDTDMVVTKKPPALDLSSLKERGPPIFTTDDPRLYQPPSPVTLPQAKAGFFGDTPKKSGQANVKKGSKGAFAVVKKKVKPPARGDRVLKRRPRQNWTEKEDEQLLALLSDAIKEAKAKGTDAKALCTNWMEIANKFSAPTRTAKQCRDRWQNYLRPGIKKGDWTEEEEHQIKALYAKYGGKWSQMALEMSHRAENDLKNKWNSMMRMEKRARLDSKASAGSNSAVSSSNSFQPITKINLVKKDPPSSDGISALSNVQFPETVSTASYAKATEQEVKEDSIMSFVTDESTSVWTEASTPLGVEKSPELGAGVTTSDKDDDGVLLAVFLAKPETST